MSSQPVDQFSDGGQADASTGLLGDGRFGRVRESVRMLRRQPGTTPADQAWGSEKRGEASGARELEPRTPDVEVNQTLRGCG